MTETAISMPPEIAKAVIQVMSKVERIDKDAKATGVRAFKYSSIDQFFEMLGPLMAEAGLLTVLHEGDVSLAEKVSLNDNGSERRSTWMLTQYLIWLYHESGASYGPIKREIQVIASGPQSYAHGPSFVMKYFLRMLFMVPTGDADADAHPQTQLPAKEERQAPTPLDEGRRRAFLEDAKQTWAKLRSQEECGAWWASTKEARIAAFPDRGEANKDYKEFTVAFARVGAKLPEKTPVTTNGATEKPKDDIPAFKGDAGRPSEANIRMDFKAALIKAIDRDGANDAFIKHIEPHEKGLPKAFLDEMYALLAKRCDEVKD